MPLCPGSASLACLMSRKRPIMFHHATHRCFLWPCDAMCAWQGSRSLHFNTKHFVLALITRQAKADGSVSSSPPRVTFIDNRACLAIIRPRQSIKRFQRKQTSFKWASFTQTTVTMFNKLVPESLGVYTPPNESGCCSSD